MIVLGIDSGVEKTGYAFLDTSKSEPKDKFLTSGLIQTSKLSSLDQRLLKIYSEVLQLSKKYKPDTIVLERLFFFKNQKTAISVSQAQGVIILLCAQNKIAIDFLTPLQIKQIVTGYGLANKSAVKKMIDLILCLKKKVKEDDEYDAIACALAYCSINRFFKKTT